MADVMRGFSLSGEEQIIAQRTVISPELKMDKPLVVKVARDRDDVLSPWIRDTQVQLFLLGLTAISSVAALYAIQRRQWEAARREQAGADALAASERFMKTLTDNLPGMVAYWDADLRCHFSNNAYFEWFGKTPEQMRGIRIQDLMGSELFKKNEPYIRAALAGESQRFERTLTKADGSIGYTWANYIPDVADGQVRGFFVLVSDITELKRAELALAESERKLKAIVEAEPECVKVMALDGRVLQMNPAGLRMLEAESEADVVGQPVVERVSPEFQEAFVALNERVGRGETGTLVFELEGLKGTRRWLDTHAVPMRDADGKVISVLSVTRDITERRKAEQELERLSQTDFLTSVHNRRHFLALATQELHRAVRYGGELSVLMMDIDYFKRINDGYGHQAGDVVLTRFAEICRMTVRDFDVLGRLGGEEFAVICPQTSVDHALQLAERLRSLVEAAEIVVSGGTTIRFTVSIGVAGFAGIDHIETLLNQADRALYQAKQAGRNRVCAYKS